MKFEKALVFRKEKNVQLLGIGERDTGELFPKTFLPDRHLAQMKGVNFKNKVEKIEIYEREFNTWREFSFNKEKDSKLYNRFIEDQFISEVDARLDDMIFLDELTVGKNGLEMSEGLIERVENYIIENSLPSGDIKEGLSAMLFEYINDYSRFSKDFSTFDVLDEIEKHSIEVPKNIEKNIDMDII